MHDRDTVFAERRGSSKTDDQAKLDLRVEQKLSLASGRIGLILDVFNVFNSAPVLEEGTLTGVDYGDPRGIATPRLARFGARFTW